MALGNRRIRVAAVIGLTLLVIGVLVVTLSADVSMLPPRSKVLRLVRRPLGINRHWFALGDQDALSNILLFIPVGLLGALAFPRRKLVVVVAATALSAGVEITQAWFLSSRAGSLDDVASNAAGALVGVLVIAGAMVALRVLRGLLGPTHHPGEQYHPAADRGHEPPGAEQRNRGDIQ